MTTHKLTLDSSASYQIVVQGYLEEHWTTWLDGVRIVPRVDSDGTSVTKLTGRVTDQAALHGLLRKLYDLGLPLLLVSRLDSDQLDMEDDGQ